MKEKIEKLNKLPGKKKKQIAIASVFSILLFIAIPVFAWFAHDRKIESMIKINAPTVITIGSGGQDVAEMIDLANINVEEKIGTSGRVLEGDYVFSIQGKYLSSYDLQIARTTNIPFDYEIYRVSSVSGVSGDENPGKGWGTTSLEIMTAMKNGTYSETRYNIAQYLDSSGTTYYYPYELSNILSGTYLNAKYESDALAGKRVPIGNGNAALGDGTFHSHNYGSYSNVNKYAQPLYWQSIDVPINSDGRQDNGHFVDYYVLKIKWTERFSNTKETDMIYITARRH